MKKQIISTIGIFIAIALLCMGLFTKVPQKEIDFTNFNGNGYEEYVGGDAYNIQIEASLRGGIIAGAKTSRAIYFSGAAIVFLLSLYGFIVDNKHLADSAETENKTESRSKLLVPGLNNSENVSKTDIVMQSDGTILCPMCKKKIDLGSTFCSHCGTPINLPKVDD